MSIAALSVLRRSMCKGFSLMCLCSAEKDVSFYQLLTCLQSKSESMACHDKMIL